MRSLNVRVAVAVLAMACSSPATRGAATGVTALPTGVTAQLIASGDTLFNRGACVRCHGARGVGGANGPSLVSGPWLHQRGTPAELAQLITAGVPREQLKDSSRRFPMNPRGGPMNLSEAQVQAIAAYVWSISRDKT